MLGDVLRDQPQMNKLANHAYPMLMAFFPAHAVDLKLIVAEFTDTLVIRPTDHLNHIAHPETLIDATNGRERNLRILQAIILFRRIKADIAVTAGFLTPFAKVIEQDQTAAGLRFRKGPHRIELMTLNILQLPGRFFFKATAQPGHVFRRVEQHRLGGQAITPGTAGFLIVRLDITRNVEVNHKSHVGFVNSHTECDGRDHDLQIIALEFLLHAGAHRVFQPGMIRRGAKTPALQASGGVFHLRPTVAVNNSGLAALVMYIA